VIAIFGYGILFFFFGTYVGFYVGMLWLEWKMRKELKKQNVDLEVVWKGSAFKKLFFDELDKEEMK